MTIRTETTNTLSCFIWLLPNFIDDTHMKDMPYILCGTLHFQYCINKSSLNYCYWLLTEQQYLISLVLEY